MLGQLRLLSTHFKTACIATLCVEMYVCVSISVYKHVCEYIYNVKLYDSGSTHFAFLSLFLGHFLLTPQGQLCDMLRVRDRPLEKEGKDLLLQYKKKWPLELKLPSCLSRHQAPQNNLILNGLSSHQELVHMRNTHPIQPLTFLCMLRPSNYEKITRNPGKFLCIRRLDPGYLISA